MSTETAVMLRCPECGSDAIAAQNKAFVTQNVSLGEAGMIYNEWTTEDVEFDGPEWFVCRDCGEHSESIALFKKKVPTDEELRKLAAQQYSSDEIEIDGNAKVSRGSDPGAFVAAWVWVNFSEAE